MGKRKNVLGMNPADVFISSPPPSPTPNETIPGEAREGDDIKIPFNGPNLDTPSAFPALSSENAFLRQTVNSSVEAVKPMIAARRGRPKKSQNEIDLENEKPGAMRGLRDGEIRATFIIPVEIYNKLKSLSYWEDIPMKDIVTRVLEKGLVHIKTKPVPFETLDEKAKRLAKLLDKSNM